MNFIVILVPLGSFQPIIGLKLPATMNHLGGLINELDKNERYLRTNYVHDNQCRQSDSFSTVVDKFQQSVYSRQDSAYPEFPEIRGDIRYMFYNK